MMALLQISQTVCQWKDSYNLSIFGSRTDRIHRCRNDFSIGGAKIERRLFSCGSKKWVKTINTIEFKVSVYAICIFGICSVQWGLGQNPTSWGILKNFCGKSNLTVCKVTLQKKIGGIILLVLPRFPRLMIAYRYSILILLLCFFLSGDLFQNA